MESLRSRLLLHSNEVNTKLQIFSRLGDKSDPAVHILTLSHDGRERGCDDRTMAQS